MMKWRTIFVCILVVAITILHYAIGKGEAYQHTVYRELYFLPIILAAFWHGTRGGILASASITVLYLPVVFMHWDGFSPTDLGRIMEVALFNIVAYVLGVLRDQEQKRKQEKTAHIAALVATIAYEMNSPLFAAFGSAELLQEDVEDATQREDVDTIIKNLSVLKDVIRKIAQLKDVTLREYAGSTDIVDLE